MSKQRNYIGFTLIELLVVIAIVGLLATVVVAGTKFVQQRGRDAKRVSDIRALKNALALYINQQSVYPNPFPAGTCITGSDAFSQELINNNLMKAVPGDPLAIWENDPNRCIRYTSASGDTYELRYFLETNSPGPIGENFTGP